MFNYLLFNTDISETPFAQFFTYIQLKDYVEFMVYWVITLTLLSLISKGILFIIDKIIPKYSIATAIDKILNK